MMKWWHLVTLLCVLTLWQVKADGHDEGEEKCDLPSLSQEVGKRSIAVADKQLILRRISEENCFVPFGLHCSKAGRKKSIDRIKEIRDMRGGKRPRPGKGRGGMGDGMPDGMQEDKMTTETPEDGMELTEDMIRENAMMGKRLCRNIGKRTVLLFKSIQRVADVNDTTATKMAARALEVVSVANDTDIPNTDAGSGSMVKGLYIKLMLVFPGKDETTNATATVDVYIAKANGTLTIGEYSGPITKGNLKFSITIDDPDNWLCSVGETGNACENFVRLVLQMKGDDGEVTRRKLKRQPCSGNANRNCGQQMELSDGSTLEMLNEATVDGTTMQLEGSDGSVSINEEGEIHTVFKFGRSFFMDPVVAAATTMDEDALEYTGFDEDGDDGTSNTNRVTFSVLLMVISLLGVGFAF